MMNQLGRNFQFRISEHSLKKLRNSGNSAEKNNIGVSLIKNRFSNFRKETEEMGEDEERI